MGAPNAHPATQEEILKPFAPSGLRDGLNGATKNETCRRKRAFTITPDYPPIIFAIPEASRLSACGDPGTLQLSRSGEERPGFCYFPAELRFGSPAYFSGCGSPRKIEPGVFPSTADNTIFLSLKGFGS